MLNKSPDQGSATIYPFPAGGRDALQAPRPAQVRPQPRPPLANEALCADSWYHQAAIDETKPS